MWRGIRRKNMKNKKGFSLVEMVVAIIVIGILSIVSVPVYRGYVKRAYESEGKALLGSIVTAEEHFYINNDYFADEDEVEVGNFIDVDASGNKYFRTFSVESDGDSFTATTYGTDAANGIELTLVYTPNGTQVYETYADAGTGGGSGSDSGVAQAMEIGGFTLQDLENKGINIHVGLMDLMGFCVPGGRLIIPEDQLAIYKTMVNSRDGEIWDHYLTHAREFAVYYQDGCPGLILTFDFIRLEAKDANGHVLFRSSTTDEEIANFLLNN